MQEMDGLAVDLGQELRIGVELGLVLPPVVAGAPLVGELADDRLWLPVVPVGGGRRRPARALEARLEVVDLGIGDGNLERVELHFLSPRGPNAAVRKQSLTPADRVRQQTVLLVRIPFTELLLPDDFPLT